MIVKTKYGHVNIDRDSARIFVAELEQLDPKRYSAIWRLSLMTSGGTRKELGDYIKTRLDGDQRLYLNYANIDYHHEQAQRESPVVVPHALEVCRIRGLFYASDFDDYLTYACHPSVHWNLEYKLGGLFGKTDFRKNFKMGSLLAINGTFNCLSITLDSGIINISNKSIELKEH